MQSLKGKTKGPSDPRRRPKPWKSKAERQKKKDMKTKASKWAPVAAALHGKTKKHVCVCVCASLFGMFVFHGFALACWAVACLCLNCVEIACWQRTPLKKFVPKLKNGNIFEGGWVSMVVWLVPGPKAPNKAIQALHPTTSKWPSWGGWCAVWFLPALAPI